MLQNGRQVIQLLGYSIRGEEEKENIVIFLNEKGNTFTLLIIFIVKSFSTNLLL